MSYFFKKTKNDKWVFNFWLLLVSSINMQVSTHDAIRQKDI